jgi:hypothetical protein
VVVAHVRERAQVRDCRGVHVRQVLRDGKAGERAGAGGALQVLIALDALLLHVPQQPLLGLEVAVEELPRDVADERGTLAVVPAVVGPLLRADPGHPVVRRLAHARVRAALVQRDLDLVLGVLRPPGVGQLRLDSGEVTLGDITLLERRLHIGVLLLGEVRPAVILGGGEDRLHLGDGTVPAFDRLVALHLDGEDQLLHGWHVRFLW